MDQSGNTNEPETKKRRLDEAVEPNEIDDVAGAVVEN